MGLFCYFSQVLKSLDPGLGGPNQFVAVKKTVYKIIF